MKIKNSMSEILPFDKKEIILDTAPPGTADNIITPSIIDAGNGKKEAKIKAISGTPII